MYPALVKRQYQQSLIRDLDRTMIVHPRMAWMIYYNNSHNVNKVCERFCISRKTFYKWLKRFQESGGNPQSLLDESRRPHRFPKATSHEVITQVILSKQITGFGQRRLQRYLAETFDIILSERTIWKFLRRYPTIEALTQTQEDGELHAVSNIVPGSIVQIGVTSLKPYLDKNGYVLYTAVDLCTHLRISKIYECHIGFHASTFIRMIIEQFPFSIKEVQTPDDRIFTNGTITTTIASTLYEPVRIVLKNAKIEQTIIREPLNEPSIIHSITSMDETQLFSQSEWKDENELSNALIEYLTFYNNHRQQNSLQNCTPLQKLRSHDGYEKQTYFILQ